MYHKDYYKILRVPRNADLGQIKSVYRRLASRFHPDVNKAPGAEDFFKQIKEAYEILSDPQKRKDYDATILNSVNNLESLKQQRSKPESQEFENFNDEWEKSLKEKYKDFNNQDSVEHEINNLKIFWQNLSGYMLLLGSIIIFVWKQIDANNPMFIYDNYVRRMNGISPNHTLFASVFMVILLLFPVNLIDYLFKTDFKDKKECMLDFLFNKLYFPYFILAYNLMYSGFGLYHIFLFLNKS